MAQVLGPISSDRWEREVSRQLRAQLPPDWVVIGNVAWSVRAEGGYVRDGQSDFVVLAPGIGMAILEVKGSQAVRIGDDGIWYRRKLTRSGAVYREEPIDEIPPQQASKNMHALAGIVCRELGRKHFPGLYAFLVVYPNGKVAHGSALYDRSTVIEARQMGQLAQRIRAALEARGSAAQASEFTTAVLQSTCNVLVDRHLVVEPVDSALDAQDDESSIHELSTQQFAALRGVFDLPRVAVLGPAGSGKTMLAIWRLMALREAGKKAIYVCFNVDLAAVLRKKHPQVAEFIESVDRMLTRIASPLPSGPRDSNFFTERLPFLAMDAAMGLGVEEKFDAIVIDEAQDFGENRLMALWELLREPTSQWALFADWQQDIYSGGSAGPLGAEVTYRLYHNCRNTISINRVTNKLLALQVESLPGMPTGVLPVVLRSSSPEVMAQRAWELARDWQTEGGVAILSPYKLENSCMARHPKGHGLSLTEDVELLGEPGYVYFSTIKSFKGIEAACVILVDAGQPGSTNALTPQDVYVACTRPTSRLAVLTLSQPSLEWFEKGLAQL